MEEQNKKSGQLHMSFNTLNAVPNDPTIMRGRVTIFDFDISGNRQCITEKVATENIQTLIGKRICCKYINKEENDGIDALGSHEETETTDRNGNEVIYCDTDAIGYIENVYIDDYTDEIGNTKRVVYGDIILWCDDHYADIIDLLKEWLEKGLNINMSVEYLYFNYSVNDGIEYILSPILFTAHTLLNSEDRGEAIEILPSYDSAKLISLNELKDQWNKAINSMSKKNINQSDNSLQSSENLDSNKLKQNNTQKEEIKTMENKFLKALNEISLGDLRSKILGQLGNVMTANEYEYMWLSNYSIFPESKYFIYETYDSEAEKWVNFKVTYSVEEDDSLTVNYDAKEKVEYQYTLVSVNELEELETSKNAKADLDTANAKIEELNGEIKSLNEKVVEKSNNSKVDTDKYNELTDKVISLNSLVVEMQPIVDKYNAEVFEKSLNKANEDYKKKFESVNALDTFDEESTQELIKQSINSDKVKAIEAKYSLNELIVNSIQPIETKVDSDDILANQAKISINQVKKAEDTKELTDVEDNVLSEFGFNY